MPYLLHQLLIRSAARDPDKLAVAFKKSSLTYGQLDTLSNQLASALRAHGVAPGDRVGIYLNKSVEAVAAVFGILKAGAVYVPLDPSAPVKRVAFIIGNCAMKALVAAPKQLASLTPALPASTALRCAIVADGNAQAAGPVQSVSWQEVCALPAAPPEPDGLIEDDLAYILYTSGSTGEPKGVMISHRASLTFVDWACDCFEVTAGDRLSNHAPLHFDLSVFDVFVAAKAGATVLPVPEELSVFPIELARFIDEQQITVWYSVPSVLTRLVLHGELRRRQFPHLRTVLFAGEVFPTKFLRQLMTLIPRPRYFNLYGPTETNVCTYYPVEPIPEGQDEPIPIGKACANTEVFAVTDQQTLAAPGELGELYVRGPSLMKGYWGLPEKTKEVLVGHPITPPPGNDRVYRTGDLVKQGPTGDYLFLGRRDNMIKSRGYRIELGEIESVLYSHPKVEEAAVVAVPDEQIGNQIKAFIVRRGRDNLTEDEVARYCSERIPKYMVPGIIEFANSLPKTSTGKIAKTVLVKQSLGGQVALL